MVQKATLKPVQINAEVHSLLKAYVRFREGVRIGKLTEEGIKLRVGIDMVQMAMLEQDAEDRGFKIGEVVSEAIREFYK